MTTPPSSSAKEAQRALGARLREVRQDAGLSGRALAAATGQHFTRVSKIEHGVQAPSDRDIRDWCRACGADDQVPDLIATARAVQSAYLEFRRQARAGMKRVLGPHTLPLYEQAKQFTVVLEEQALRTWFGTAEIQAGQLGRLLEVTSIPTVSLGIIPMMTERTAVPSAGFWIFDDSLVALETPTASIEVTRPREIDLYSRMFKHLSNSAVHGAAARSLIIQTLGELT